MSLFVKLALILFGLAYLISPVDIIPDILVPYLGWLDDGLVLWCVYYLLRHGQLPWFLFKKKPLGRSHADPGPEGAKTGSEKQGRSNRPSNSGAPRKNDKTQFRSPKPGSEYRILGLGPDAPWKEIQAAYKEKIKKYHPDKVNHLGEEFSDLANEKFLEIQQAYESLKRKKGR
ncbi:DnaJ domain-containing protein [Desulfospira joergensenii]|uniref:DnaJ domain-containing protein n=1 Tax=Desulfospira joergensenii TaxID=53329 RepID=UPI0003B58548|nr:DnaJ domain-containing protein [Desulfospira joergensenii]